jgi:hypothetical protein
MKNGIRAFIIAIAISALGASTALAAPPHGEGGHPHHVRTGSGGCVELNQVLFHFDVRGLHRGSNASSSFDITTFDPADPSTYPVMRGPWHGSCAAPF